MKQQRSNGRRNCIPSIQPHVATQDGNVVFGLVEMCSDYKENISPSILLHAAVEVEALQPIDYTGTTKFKCKHAAELRPVNRASSPANPSPQEVFLQVKSTSDRGLAVFATRKIKAGTLILLEDPLLLLSKDEENDHSAIEREFSKLSRPDQKKYLKLFDAEKSRMSQVASIYYSNCYNLDGFVQDAQGGSAVGEFASRFNHSCVPNAQFSYDAEKSLITFHAIKDIPRGKEILSNYEKNPFEIAVKRKQKLQMYYGFLCRCEACEGGKKNAFWGKSDERRKAMRDVFKHVQECEKLFLRNVELENRVIADQEQEQKQVATEDAISVLGKLEGLLLKEGLMGVVLANIYRSLCKWSERKGDLAEAVKWKEKERDHCLLVFGTHALRTQEAEKRLMELKEGVE